MTLFGIQLSVLIVALITAYIGYQFNFRAKRREVFIKELLHSYNEVYFPMNELLKVIKDTKSRDDYLKLINEFFVKYEGPDSKIRFIGTSSLLEKFYSLREIHNNFREEPSRVNEIELKEKLVEFHNMIHNECWDAHDIIYEDHLNFKNMSHKNPLVVLIMELIAAMYYAVNLLLWVSLIIIYFSLINHFIRIEQIPDWWRLKYAIYIFVGILAIYGVMLMYSLLVIKKNKRKIFTLKNMKNIFK